MGIEIKTFTGPAILPHIEAVGKLRIEVFRAFPYLYEGDMAYERSYLHTFASAKNNVLVLALDGEAVVGASTALPMTEESENIKAPFQDYHIPMEQIFYFGESVLLPHYRGRGIGVQFFEEREAFAERLTNMQLMCFCGVVRPEDHPLRPSHYQPLNQFWKNRGFRQTDLYCKIAWQDVDKEEETDKQLRFWTKKIRR